MRPYLDLLHHLLLMEDSFQVHRLRVAYMGWLLFDSSNKLVSSHERLMYSVTLNLYLLKYYLHLLSSTLKPKGPEFSLSFLYLIGSNAFMHRTNSS